MELARAGSGNIPKRFGLDMSKDFIPMSVFSESSSQGKDNFSLSLWHESLVVNTSQILTFSNDRILISLFVVSHFWIIIALWFSISLFIYHPEMNLILFKDLLWNV